MKATVNFLIFTQVAAGVLFGLLGATTARLVETDLSTSPTCTGEVETR